MLLAICVVIYLLDHTPYVLVSLAATTLAYTQILSRLDLPHCWHAIRTRWEEYQQHEDSIQQAHSRTVQSPADEVLRPHIASPDSPGSMFTMLPVIARGASHSQRCSSPKTAHWPNRVIPSSSPVLSCSAGCGPNVSKPSSFSKTDSYCYQSKQLETAKNQKHSYCLPKYDVRNGRLSYSDLPVFENKDSINCARLFDLKQKQLLSDRSGRCGNSGKHVNAISSIKNKILSAIGLVVPAKMPPGLKNRGRNCFVNSVVQCLARTPYFTHCLAVDAAKELEVTVSDSNFLLALSGLLDLLTAEPKALGSSVLDPVKLVHSMSVLNPNLIVPVGRPQPQQDAAEYLMWLLATVHRILHQNRQALSCGETCSLCYSVLKT